MRSRRFEKSSVHNLQYTFKHPASKRTSSFLKSPAIGLSFVRRNLLRLPFHQETKIHLSDSLFYSSARRLRCGCTNDLRGSFSVFPHSILRRQPNRPTNSAKRTRTPWTTTTGSESHSKRRCITKGQI